MKKGNAINQPSLTFHKILLKRGKAMPENAINGKLRDKISHYIIDVSVPREGFIFIQARKDHLRDLITFLKNEGFTHLAGITALQTENGLELLYHLSKSGTLINVRVNLPLNDDVAPTITDIIPAALLYEREAHDLFGIKFDGHPNMKPLILPDDWPENVYPLRKCSIEKMKINRTN